MSVGVSCNFMDTVVSGEHNAMADVIPLCYISSCYALNCGIYYCQFVMLYMWLMVGHWGRCYSLCAEQSGRCYCHGGRCNGPLRVGLYWTSGRCYWHGDRWNGHLRVYFNISSEVLRTTSSHIQGRWYLPVFLFKRWIYGPLYLIFLWWF